MVLIAWVHLSEILKNVGQFLGFVGAGVYFAFKAYVGYFYANLSLEPKAVRRRKTRSVDFLVVTVALTKGDQASLELFTATSKVSEVSFSQATPGVPEISSLDEKLTRQFPTARITGGEQWAGNDRHGNTLSPGERTELSELYEVESDKSYYIDIVVGARFARPARLKWLPGTNVPQQWCARVVSHPLPPEDLANSHAQ